MSAAKAPETNLGLTTHEREVLLIVLEEALREARVETHRTEAFEARKLMADHEATLQAVVDKLRRLGT